MLTVTLFKHYGLKCLNNIVVLIMLTRFLSYENMLTQAVSKR